jgi:cysteine desulfurase / selenocysteine lyase
MARRRQGLDCDFYAFSGHKCYGPTGVGVLYGKKELLEVMPPVQGGGDMIERVDLERTTYQMPPLRFEAGTPIIAEVVALKTALEFIETHRQPDALLPYATERLEAIPGLKVLGTASQKGPILTFHIEGVHPLDLATLLDLKNIAIRSGHLCAQPLLRKWGLMAAARASFAIYNTPQEIDLFAEALAEVASQLSSLRVF